MNNTLKRKLEYFKEQFKHMNLNIEVYPWWEGDFVLKMYWKGYKLVPFRIKEEHIISDLEKLMFLVKMRKFIDKKEMGIIYQELLNSYGKTLGELFLEYKDYVFDKKDKEND